MTVTYTITADNSHKATKDVTGVVITDTLDPGLTFNSGSVQVNGVATTDYGYDSADCVLTVSLGNVAPDTTDVVTFTCVINSVAMNGTIKNVAAVSSTSDPTQNPKSPDIAIGGGNAMGSVSKTVDKAQASVGETLTYTVNAINSTLSHDAWKSVTMTDVIPTGLTYVDGSVSIALNGSLIPAAANYATATRTLTVNVGDIPIGQSATIQYKTTVDSGMQGKSVDNTAVVKGTDGIPYTATSGETVIDDGNVVPSVVKTSAPDTVNLNDTVHYTITVKNGITATVDWRNVIIDDTIPAGLSLNGVVYVDGGVGSYSKSGNSINVKLGDIAPNQTVTIMYDATANVVGTYTNTAVASSSNGPDVSGSDGGVTVASPSTPGETTTHPDYGFTGSKAASTAQVNAGDDFTYTIVVQNPMGNAYTWYNVVITDPLNLAYIIPYIDSVTINGVAAGARATYDTALNISLGNLTPGETDTVQFTVKATTDAAGQTITNVGYINGYVDPSNSTEASVIATANPVYIAQTVPPQLISDDHIQLFQGYTTGEWEPERYISRAEVVHVLYQIVIANHFPQPSVQKPVPPDIPSGSTFWAYQSLMYFYNMGALRVDASGNLNPNTPATMSDIVSCAQAIGIDLPALGYLPSDATQLRVDTAKMMCAAQQRDPSPDTNGCSVPVFNDVPADLSDPTYLLICEVSSTHSYILKAPGSTNEIWISSTWSSLMG